MNMQDSYTFVVYVSVMNFSFSLKTKCPTHSGDLLHRLPSKLPGSNKLPDVNYVDYISKSKKFLQTVLNCPDGTHFSIIQ